MLTFRRFPLKLVISFGLRLAGMHVLWATVVYALYFYGNWTFLRIPFLPVATVGTAVAFYVGFKNNAAYDRFWEGRKIWGGIVNSSRTWANFVLNYVEPGNESPAAVATRKLLIYRQLAWINALRMQLRKTSRFFDKPAPGTKRRLDNHAVAMRNDWDLELKPFLETDELARTREVGNAASHLLLWQGDLLASLVREKRLELFHQIAMMEVVEELYALMGKCERIKNTPFPRQYAEYSRIFTRVFTVFVPLGLLDVFSDTVSTGGLVSNTWFQALPMLVASGLVSWVFMTMEGIGDASEDPFERSMNDVPMNALCRTIEIDIRQMLGESDLPEKEPAHDFILY